MPTRSSRPAGDSTTASSCSVGPSPRRAARVRSPAAPPCRPPCSPRSPTSSSPCTASPTSTDCCAPSAQRQALDTFAGEPLGEVMGEYAPGVRASDVRWRAASTSCARTPRSGPASSTCCATDSTRSRRSSPAPGRTTSSRPRKAGWPTPRRWSPPRWAAHEAVSGDIDDAGSARTQVAGAVAGLDDAAGHDPELDQLAARLREVGILLDEAATELSAYATSVDLDPARLATVQDRIAALTALQRKYGPSLDDVLTWQQKAAARLGELGSDDDTIGELEAERDQLRPEVQRPGRAARRAAARGRSAAVRPRRRRAGPALDAGGAPGRAGGHAGRRRRRAVRTRRGGAAVRREQRLTAASTRQGGERRRAVPA